VWLYGQGLWSRSDDPDFVLMDVGAIYAFSAQEGDHECANVCLDVIREVLVDEHSTVTIHLNTLLDFLDQSQEAFQMLIDLLVYGPFASSGFTRGWLEQARVEQGWASFFHRLSLAFATRVANEAAGDESKHPDIMDPDRYHLPVEDDDTASGSATEVGETVSSSQNSLKSSG
jgi:hypothetical protein